MAECMGFAYTVPVHKPHVQNNSNRINGIIRGKFVLLCLPGRSKNEHYSKIFPVVWYLITLAVMYFPEKEINGTFYFIAVLELFEIYIPKKFLEMEERRKKKSILVENAEFIIHEYLMKMIKNKKV